MMYSPAPVARLPQGEKQKTSRKRIGWAELLARVFAMDMKNGPNCGKGELKPIAAILETQAIIKILDHMGLPSRPPDIAPANLDRAIEFCRA